MNQAQANALKKASGRAWRQSRLPGLAVAITDKKRVIFEAGFGSLSPASIVPIGSIGKSMLCRCLHRLHARGKLKLDDPVSRHLPWFKHRSITLQHLMDHTAGIVTGPEMGPVGGLANALVLNQLKPGAPPGEAFHYSNVGYKVLGFVVEKVAGKSLAEVCSEEILEPLGMRRSFGRVGPENRDKMGQGYIEKWIDRPSPISRPLVPAPWLDYPGGDGCLATDVRDLCRYLRDLLNQDIADPAQPMGGIIYPRAPLYQGKNYFYKNGWFVVKGQGTTVMGHGGYHVGYSSSARLDLKSGLGLALLYNGPWYWLNAYALAAHLLSLAQAQAAPAPEPAFGWATPGAGRYAGSYVSRGQSLRMSARGNELSLEHQGRRIKLERRGRHRFFADHPSFSLFHLEFAEREGKIEELHYGGELFVRRGVRLKVQPLAPAWKAFPGHYRSHDPWNPSFKVVERKGRLWQISPDGSATELAPMGKSRFWLKYRKHPIEILEFSDVIEGSAQTALLSGEPYYRSLI